ncbi:MAG: hypothetical protein IPN29_10065 [Saprospiraceae bacterium]|nr:hypothetical protein [Saprospiraceae bacterium]
MTKISSFILFMHFGFFFMLSWGAKASDSLGVYFFMLEDCVICQSYTPLIQTLHENYGQHADFHLIFPNQRSKGKGIRDFMDKYGLALPYKTDHYKNLCKKWDVKVTPEVVIVNEKTGFVYYKGRIDDGYVRVGRKKTIPSQNDLEAMLICLSNGLNCEPKQTTAIGCYINLSENQ